MAFDQNVQYHEIVVATGTIFELVQVEQLDGRVFETARRAPGVRIIIADTDKKKILLTKEFRRELGGYDYRLPGGKVFDTLAEYSQFRETGADMKQAVMNKARQESIEETGIVIDELDVTSKSTLGTTVEWDLFVTVTTKWHFAEDGQDLQVGEDIAADEWFDYEVAYKMALEGDMSEERVALLLMRWINEQKEGE